MATVSLSARELEVVLTELEQVFSAQGVPTARRLRAAVLAEEVFSAVRRAAGDEGQLRCTFPRARTVMLQYRDKRGAPAPDLGMAQRLNRNPCTDGVSARFLEGRCIITAK